MPLVCGNWISDLLYVFFILLSPSVIWLIGEWTDHIPNEARPAIYQHIVAMLGDQVGFWRYRDNVDSFCREFVCCLGSLCDMFCLFVSVYFIF